MVHRNELAPDGELTACAVGSWVVRQRERTVGHSGRPSHARATAVSVDYCNRGREQAWTVAAAVLPPIVQDGRLGARA